MTLLVVATYPMAGGPVLFGPVSLSASGESTVADVTIPASMGSSALLGAAYQALAHLKQGPPLALLAGDIGEGEGSRELLRLLPEIVEEHRPSVVVLHYLQPYTDPILAAISAIREIDPGIVLIGDAGGMYAAKAAGAAPLFELLTPDLGEAGYLADPESTHPAYVSNFLLSADRLMPADLARNAWDTGGSGPGLIIKGAVDHIAWRGEVVATVDAPMIPALEAIGGTGDTITGLASAFIASGFPTVDAAVCACRANRAAGVAIDASPATRISELIAVLPEVLADGLCGWAGVCSID